MEDRPPTAVAAYSLIRDLRNQRISMAVVADDTHVEYLLPPGRTSKFFSQRRIDRLLRHAKQTPEDAVGWIKLAAYNIGYTAPTTPQWFPNFDEAKLAAESAR